MASIQEKNLRELEYQSRETGEFHHEVSQEEYLIEKVKSGDESFLEDFSLEDDSIHAGHLSDDPVQRFRHGSRRLSKQDGCPLFSDTSPDSE